MLTGRVIWFVSTVGLGFIRPDDGSPDVVVRMDEVAAAGLTTLEVDQHLAFEVKEEGMKRRALNLNAV